MRIEFDCGCGLKDTDKIMDYWVENGKPFEKDTHGWFPVLLSASRMRKCRTCGKRCRHGYERKT